MDAVLSFLTTPAGIALAALIIAALIALVVLVVRRSRSAPPSRYNQDRHIFQEVFQCS